MIEIKKLSKFFDSEQGKIEALKDISLKINDGDIYGIIGMSGAGKSTLVRCINLLEKPSSGDIIIDGENIVDFNKKKLNKTRKKISMIFQSFNLLLQRNCLDNICLPMELEGIKRNVAKRRAEELIELVGLSDKKDAYPVQLSGGQQQRIAIARALATNPKVLLCDEATSALDPKTTSSILSLLKEINKKLNITIIIITHQMNVVDEICNKVAIIEDGIVVEDGEVKDIFAAPKSEAAKNLVYSDKSFLKNINTKEEILIRVVFTGYLITNKPIISQLAIEKNILVNIHFASTKTIGDKIFGNIVFSLKNENNNLNEITDYLSKIENVAVTIINDGGEK